MFVNINRSESITQLRIFWLVIIVELLICGERGVVFGRHLHRHSNSRRLHRQSIYPIVPAAAAAASEENLESINDIPEFEKLKAKVDCVYTEDNSGVQMEGNPEIRSVQSQPEDFVFLDDAHYAPNELGTNERFTYIEDNELDQDRAGEKVEDKNSAINPAIITPPCIGSRNIIKAPLRDCAKGERRDSMGECRLVISIK